MPGLGRHAALAAFAASALLAQRASAQSSYKVDSGTCSGCAICLDVHEAGPYPIRSAQACSDFAGCFPADPHPIRFDDLTAHRGLLQIVSSSVDQTGCPQTLFGNARWNSTNTAAGADVFFTGPSGATSVSTRVRYRVSTAATGDAHFTFSARFQNTWANEAPVPANVTDFELVSPITNMGLDFWRTCEADIQSAAVNGTACYLLHFPLNEPVFDLPAGYTANSPTLGIVDNIWQGLDVEGDWNASSGEVPCFSALPLIHSVAGNLIVENTVAVRIDLGALSSVGGNIIISGNASTDSIELGALSNAGSDVTITGNGSSALLRGGSASPLTVDLSSLVSVEGDLDVSGNLQDTSLALASLALVDGNLTLDALVNGALDLSAAAVFGSIDIEALGADSVTVATPGIAGATTEIAIARDQSSIDVQLPADAFASSEFLSVTYFDRGPWRVAALDAAGRPVSLSLLATYSVEATGNPVLQQDATLALELNVAALPAALQAAVLEALADDRVVLTRDDGPWNLNQVLAICPPSTPPVSNGCVVLALLDANHLPLPSGSPEAPAFVRFTAATDRLAEYAIALEGLSHTTQSGSSPTAVSGGLVVPLTVARNGSNVNLLALVQTSPAIVGSEWRGALALEGVSRTALFLSMKGPAQGVFVPGGELLLQPPVRLLPDRTLSFTIPRDPRLVGCTFSTQAAVFMSGSWRLTNALDVTIGGSN